MRRYINVLLALSGLVLAVGDGRAGESQVIVNDEVLDAETHRGLEETYRTKLIPGRYWYDTVSGLWGLEGGPSLGQIVAGMQIGRGLAADASVKDMRSRTFVFVNGREIHPQELQSLIRLYGSVREGRYWLNARGIAGREGGPPEFDLRAAAMARAPQSRGPGYSHRGVFGNTASDGDCGYYNDPASGASVMTGNC